MFSTRVRQFLQWQKLITWLAGLLFGLLVSVFSNRLSAEWANWLPWVGIIALIVGGVSVWLFLRRPPGIGVAIRSPRTIRSSQEAQQYARRGFVGFVPLYTPQPGTPAASLTVEERLAAAEGLDFERLQPEASNLWPTIEAILSHASRLEHCWLLATRGQSVPGSQPYAQFLAQYLHQHKGLKCKFYYGDVYTIGLDDDALILSKTYDQVQAVLRQAVRLKLSPNEVVADISSGVRSMTLGMVLACLDGDQDVEFVGTRYNDQGQPVGELFPIIFSFEPLLK
jgi:hypothetical protein